MSVGSPRHNRRDLKLRNPEQTLLMADPPSPIIETAHSVMDLHLALSGLRSPSLTLVTGAFLPCFAN